MGYAPVTIIVLGLGGLIQRTYRTNRYEDEEWIQLMFNPGPAEPAWVVVMELTGKPVFHRLHEHDPAFFIGSDPWRLIRVCQSVVPFRVICGQ